jgi:hypothetical protein
MKTPDIFGISTVTSLDGWKSISRNHENENRSAYLVGQRWLGSKGEFPPAIKSLMTASMGSLRLAFSVAEHITVLDTLVAPSRTDLMVYCGDGKSAKSVIAIEGKFTEGFAERIVYWIRDEKEARGTLSRQDLLSLEIKVGRQRRLQWLCNLLDLSFDDQSEIRYQLLHRTVCALLEAKHIGANSAIMLVQAFADCPENWDDYAEFAEKMGFTSIAPNSISEAKVLSAFPGISLHLGWAYDLSEKHS